MLFIKYFYFDIDYITWTKRGKSLFFVALRDKVNKFNDVDYDIENDESIIQEETPDDFKDNRLLFKLIVINFLDSLKECLKSRKFSLDAKKIWIH